ncbi:MAG: T9SS type A sorting domain-containing protein, partial [Bacteroidota bacterium]
AAALVAAVLGDAVEAAGGERGAGLTALGRTAGTEAASRTAPVEALVLEVPYPNPAAGSATVPVVLAERAAVRVAVFDVLGREVAVLHDGFAEAGTHRFAFDAADLPSGVYLVRAAVSGAGGGPAYTQPITLVN